MPDRASVAPMPRLDRLLGEWTGEVLTWLAKRAKRRGDAHEFAHLYAAVVMGNSNHDGKWPCGLAYVEGYLGTRDDASLRTFTVTLTSPGSADNAAPGGTS